MNCPVCKTDSTYVPGSAIGEDIEPGQELVTWMCGYEHSWQGPLEDDPDLHDELLEDLENDSSAADSDESID